MDTLVVAAAASALAPVAHADTPWTIPPVVQNSPTNLPRIRQGVRDTVQKAKSTSACPSASDNETNGK